MSKKKLGKRQRFEAFYAEIMSVEGHRVLPEDIASKRDGPGYGERESEMVLNHYWLSWDAIEQYIERRSEAHRVPSLEG